MKLDIKIDDQDLPMISAVAMEALDLLKDPNVTNQKMEDLICHDPSLAARVLRTANSPFYGSRMQVATISDAIFRLGMRQLRNVIVMAAAGEFFNDNDPVIQLLWQHSIDTAMVANYLANDLDFSGMAEVFIAGLLHDIGKLIILRQHHDVYVPLIQQAVESQTRLHLLEAETFSYFTHMSVGGLVVRQWKLHECIAEAARFHHDVDREFPNFINHDKIVGIVALADELTNVARTEREGIEWAQVKDFAYIQALRLNEKKFKAMEEAVIKQIRNQ